jgi:ABC-type Fe3+ transport system permease subunit
MNILLIFSLIILTLSYISIVLNGLSLNYLFKLKDETNPQEIIDNQISKSSTISISLISAILICAIIILFSENNRQNFNTKWLNKR